MEMMELVYPMTKEQLQRLRRQVALLPGSPNADAMQASLRAIDESLFTKELAMDELHVLVPFARALPDQLPELGNLIEQNLLNRASETVKILNQIFYQILFRFQTPATATPQR
jgi:hypothetical protein